MTTVCAMVVCGEDGYINNFLTALHRAFPYVVVTSERTEGRYYGKLKFCEKTRAEHIEAFAQRSDHEVQVGMCNCASQY